MNNKTLRRTSSWAFLVSAVRLGNVSMPAPHALRSAAPHATTTRGDSYGGSAARSPRLSVNASRPSAAILRVVRIKVAVEYPTAATGHVIRNEEVVRDNSVSL